MISKRNNRGLAILVILGCVLAFVPRIVASVQNENSIEISFEEVKAIEQSIYSKQFATSENKREERRKSKFQSKKKYNLPPRKFDPNKTSKEDWLYLGLSERQAEVVMSFLKRPVYSAEDLRRIYVIPEEVMEAVLDSALFPTPAVAKVTEENYFLDNEGDFETNEIFDLNTVTKSQLESLSGIGPFYAGKIVEYRNRLGGYHKKEQLLELWKFDQEKLNGIQDRISVENPNLQKIDINSADVEVLKRHPYISYSVANSIIKMRDQHGDFSSINDLKKSVLIDQGFIDKMTPYLVVK